MFLARHYKCDITKSAAFMYACVGCATATRGRTGGGRGAGGRASSHEGVDCFVSALALLETKQLGNRIGSFLQGNIEVFNSRCFMRPSSKQCVAPNPKSRRAVLVETVLYYDLFQSNFLCVCFLFGLLRHEIEIQTPSNLKCPRLVVQSRRTGGRADGRAAMEELT